jgi:C1A family cysteine protease
MYVKQRKTRQGQDVTVNGWFAPGPDLRDYNDRHPAIVEVNERLGIKAIRADELPVIIDLRAKMPPIRNQGNLGSCVAFGIVSCLEYHALKIQEKYVRLSERALYKSMRFLLGLNGDSGGYVRAGMGAAKALGIPPSKYWPYDTSRFDDDIPAMVQNVGENFSGITYFRHDGGTNTPPECALASAHKYLANGMPFVFAFYGFDSFDDGGKIPLPGPGESAQWGHCVAGVGYDDEIVIPTGDGKSTTQGAIIFRNSWGSGWGIGGYGYLPYEYFLRRYARDMWTVIDAAWLDTGLYGF